MHAIVFSGIQGCGKTTFYRERFFDTHVRLSLDLFKTRSRENILLHACVAAQQPFVVDNTNTASKVRRRYAQLAAAAGFRTTLYFFDCPAALALRRNAQRLGKSRVPDLAIRGALAKLEPPSHEEGFDQICRVVVREDGLVVEPWGDLR